MLCLGTILPLAVNYLSPNASSLSLLSTQGLHFLSLLPLSALPRAANAHCEFTRCLSALAYVFLFYFIFFNFKPKTMAEK